MQLLGKAAEQGVQCTALRIGQICGSQDTGAWAPTEWVPILVKSSIALESLPEMDGVGLPFTHGCRTSF